jgi:outer membrane receptor protein involved in Fe transport
MKNLITTLFTLMLFSSAFGQTDDSVMDSISLANVTVTSGVIDVAKERETPFAVSNISVRDISLKIGNLEFPEIMNKTPGVYATKGSGGYGDAFMYLRGFSQLNTAFLINGQPVNDMENGRVFWSNWAGLVDVASGIQIQRGLGSTSMAVPSVGGTVSIFTKTTEVPEGGSMQQLIGNDGYSKSTFVYNTGVNDSGWSSSFLLTKWKGDGYVYNTKGEGTTYYFGVGYDPIGSDHSFNFSILGAGQWHHQRDVWVSVRDYQNFGEEGVDRRWNSNGGTLNGEEWSFRRNFYNKPLATFNWDWEVSSNVTVNTSLYGSAGRGGGTGPRGNNFRNDNVDILPFRSDLTEHLLEDGDGAAARDADGFINYDYIVSHNQNNTSPYTGEISDYSGLKIGSNGFRNDGVNREILIRRASMNSHNWIGGIQKINIQADKWRYSFGYDLRSYDGYHYRALNHLLGLDGYYSTGDDNTNGKIMEATIEASPFQNTGIQGPKLGYYNLGKVGWFGLNALAEYSFNDLTAVIQMGWSEQKFQRIDYFSQATNYKSETSKLDGGYIKVGANYNLNEQSNIFANIGRIERQPNFDGVFPNFANNINPNLQNEEITSFELGYGFIADKFRFNVNLYATTWGNRFISRSISNAQGTDGRANFNDVDVQHNGLEIEAVWQPDLATRVRGMISIGDWRYTDDFSATIFDDNQQQIGTGTLYLKDAKVGDAAQTTAYIGIERRIGSKFSFDIDYRFADNLYADYSVTDSDFLKPNNDGAYQLPAYGLVDLGASAYFGKFTLRANINNLFDKLYIAESNSNIHVTYGSTTWQGVDDRNYVWFGYGTTWNLSLKYRF